MMRDNQIRDILTHNQQRQGISEIPKQLLDNVQCLKNIRALESYVASGILVSLHL